MKFISKDSTFTPQTPSPLASKPPSSLVSRGESLRLDSITPTTNGDNDDDDDASSPKNPSVPPEFLRQLATFPLFKNAPKSFHSNIATKLTLLSVHPQHYIVKKGDPSTAMYWILKGTVVVTSTDGESVYAELMPGSFFGEIGTLYNRPRTATVIARTRVLVAVLTTKALNTVLKSYPMIERRIRDEAQERLAMQEKRKKRYKKHALFDSSCQNLRPAQPTTDDGSFSKNYLRSFEIPNNRSLIFHPLYLPNKTLSIQDFIRQLPIFATLPADIIHKIALNVEPVSVGPYEYIFKKGDTGANIYFIVDGDVEVLDYDENKQEKQLGRLSSADYFGEITFLGYLNNVSDVARTATLRSIGTVELLVVQSKHLQRLCEEYPFIIDQMKRTADMRIRQKKRTVPKSKLSIDYLINDAESSVKSDEYFTPLPHSNESNGDTSNSDKNTTDRILKNQYLTGSGLKTELSENDTFNDSSTNTNATLYQPKPIFSKTWNFNSSSESKKSRSVSPVNSATTSPSPTTFERPPLRKRTSVYDEETAIPLTLPPLNPRSPSLNNFNTNTYKQAEGNFQYVPLNKRLKLANVGGRRRSSILSINGSLPDKVLIRIFEYLLLPELMKLRIVSRRWRQLLNAAPNLMNVLDLTPWNTTITDKVLIQITDFVGSRPRHINISNCFHITDEGFSYMINEIGMAGRIKSLKMKSDWEISAMAIMDLTAPSVGKYLEELDLSNCRKVQDDVLIRLIGWNSSNSQNDPFEMDYDSDRIGCKNLRILNVSYCKHITDRFMLHLSKNGGSRLECLDLTRCTTISDKGFQYWTYNSFPNLKKVSLKDCTFVTDESIISLTRAAPNLEILNSNFCCSLTEVAIDVLCMGNLNLRELDLSFCGSAVSDSSLVAISLQLRKLERLIVRGCTRVTRAGVDALLSGYAPLKFIDISQCKNAHAYPEGVPAQEFNVNPLTKSAFVIAGPYQKVIEIVI